MPHRKGPPLQRIIDRLNRKHVVDGSGCWLWTGFIMRNGYGRLTNRLGRTALAHRLMYEETIGPIPKGMDLDHLCRVRRCINPDHLEPVPRRVNLERSP